MRKNIKTVRDIAIILFVIYMLMFMSSTYGFFNVQKTAKCEHKPYVVINEDTLHVHWNKDIRERVTFSSTKKRQKATW